MGDELIGKGYDLLCQCFQIIYDLLTASAIDYSRTNHTYAFMILRSFKAIGLAIVIILTYMSFIRQSSIIIERHPESVFKVLLRAVIVSFLVTNCTTYFGDAFVHGLGMLAKTVFNSAGFYGNNFADHLSKINLATATTEATKDKSTWDLLSAAIEKLEDLCVFIFKIIYVVTMITTGFHMIVTVFTRYMKIYLYTCTMPIGISFFADPQFSQYGKNWARTYVGACLEGVTIAIAIVLFCGMVGSNMLTKALGTTLGESEIFKYFIYISLLKVMSQTVTGAENFTNKLFGLS